jgi:SMC interacting uncharacterized protein involved in chromosome segregation
MSDIDMEDLKRDIKSRELLIHKEISQVRNALNSLLCLVQAISEETKSQIDMIKQMNDGGGA